VQTDQDLAGAFRYGATCEENPVMKCRILLVVAAGCLSAACDYPANPKACANNPMGWCGLGVAFCRDDGRASECRPIHEACVSARWPDECTASRPDAGADGSVPADGTRSEGCPEACTPGSTSCGDRGVRECIVQD
jgi:hypothetical protein